MFRKTALLLTTFIFGFIGYNSLRSVHPGEATEQGTPQFVLEDVNPSTRAPLVQAPPLRTAGRHIVDANGTRVKLASVNWYGASDLYFVAGGLDVRHRDAIAQTIKEMGFNSVRFPYSDQMVLENPVIDPELISANLDLLDRFDLRQSGEDIQGPKALDVFNACVKAMTDAGLAVIVNDHITNAAWCDGMNLCDSSWKNDHLWPLCKVKQTTESWIENWKTIMKPLVDNPLVVGADLRNEPRGIWGTFTWSKWAKAAERASEALLEMQPNWLMIVEGTSSANDCSGAKTRPISLSLPNRLVYSSHVYSWSGWGTIPSIPYNKRPYPSFRSDMVRKWGYLLENDLAPVWVGEFGAPGWAAEGRGDRHYWEGLVRYLAEVDGDWGYWALNPRKPADDSEESYGLLEDDWKTPREDYRLKDLRRLMMPRRT